MDKIEELSKKVGENYVRISLGDTLIPVEIIKQSNKQFIANITKNPSQKDPLTGVTYDDRFLESDSDTIQCRYDKILQCDKNTYNQQIEFYMSLNELKNSKIIYFHDQRCHNKAVVENLNAQSGKTCVNLSYI